LLSYSDFIPSQHCYALLAQAGHFVGFGQLFAKLLATNLLLASSNFPRLISLKKLLSTGRGNFLVIDL
jgi:hypothetical protein